MRRHALLLLAVLGAFAAPASPADAAGVSCGSGHTLAKPSGARIFSVDSRQGVYACRAHDHRAIRLVAHDPVHGRFTLGPRQGSVVSFVDEAFDDAVGGCGEDVGWVDVRTGRHAAGSAFSTSDECPTVDDVAVAPSGTIAVVSHTDGDDQRVVSLNTAAAHGKLRDGRGLAFVRGTFAKGSLRIDAAAVTWRDDDGGRQVPLSGEPETCSAGRTRASAGPVRLFEVFDRASGRGALRWCGPKAAGPQSLPPRRGSSTLVDDLRLGPSTGGRTPFATGDLAGIIDTQAGAVRAVATPAATPYVAVAAGPAGELVAAIDPRAKTPEGGIVVVPATSATSFGAPRLIATTAKAVDPKSFVLTGAGVTFRTPPEPARTVPLTGETTVDCTAGTTLGRADGLRLFEVLDVADGRRGLFACRDATPGTSPVALLANPIATTFAAQLIGVSAGRGVVVSRSQGAHGPGTVLTFAATTDSVRAGTIPPDSRAIEFLDAAVAPDGGVALLSDADFDEDDVEASFLAPTPTGLATARRVAAKSGGYTPGSLGASATDITWKTKAGGTIHVARPSS